MFNALSPGPTGPTEADMDEELHSVSSKASQGAKPSSVKVGVSKFSKYRIPSSICILQDFISNLVQLRTILS